MLNEHKKTGDIKPLGNLKVEKKKDKEIISFKSKFFLVKNKNNRTIEVPIGRYIFKFDPYQERRIKEDEINHKDFKQMAHYFSIREV